MSFECRLIRYDEYEAAMRVWEKCFPEDSETFIRYYFEKRTSPSAVFAAFDGSEMVGALHMLDCRARFFGETRWVGFVVGVGTIPEARSRGVAAQLMRASFSVMRDRGYSATILKPSSFELFKFYRRFGYETLSIAARMERFFDLKAPNLALVRPSPAAMLAAFEGFTKEYDGVIARTEGDFALLLEEAKISHSLVYASATAYALGERVEDGIGLTELAGEGALELVNAIAGAEGQRVYFQLPPDHPIAKDAVAEPFDMLRILDVPAFLVGLHAREGGYRIAIEDADGAGTDGIYELAVTQGRVKSCERVDAGAHECMDIGALAGNVSGTLPSRFALRERPCYGMKRY